MTDLLVGLHDFGFDDGQFVDGHAYCDVDSLDGMMLALSPWALANLYLEGAGYAGFHGYDAELCTQARVKGKRVVVADIRATHHSRGGFTAGLEEANRVFQYRWLPVDPRLAPMIQKVREAGTDSLSHFGNGYTHEGGLYLQQNPEEFAQLALLLKNRQGTDTYLEIGSASGGAMLFLARESMAGFTSLISIDDGKHPRAKHQAELLPLRTKRFVGDSHSQEAEDFLAECADVEVAFIDGDHSYEGVTADIAMVLPFCEPGALIILHDTVACDGVKRAWEELLASGKVKKVAEYIGAEKPLGIGVAEVVAVEEKKDPWANLRANPKSGVEAAYREHRGGPVSATPHVMLATPAYNPPCIEFLASREAVAQDLLKHGIGANALLTPGDSLVMRGRHVIVSEFLKSEATHLLFWDVDIVPLDPAVVRHMLDTGHEVVGGACPFRGETGQVVCNLRQVDRERRLLDSDDTSCVIVNEVGTGFMLLARTAIVAMCEQYPELMYLADLPGEHGMPMWALFDTKIENRRFLSEDYFFCQLWRDMGGNVHVYVPFEAEHWGRKGFRANFMSAHGMTAT